MMKRTLMMAALLMAMLLCLSGAAAQLPEDLTSIGSEAFAGDTSLKGVVTLPAGVTEVGSRAFANTGVHALVVNEACASLPADVLAGGNAAYVRLSSSGTELSAALTDVPYIFAPAGSAAASLTGFYATETLQAQDGFYFSLDEDEALPLCAVSPMTGAVTVPKFVGDLPLRQLDTLVLNGLSGANLCVPSYLTLPEGMTATTYDAMTLTEPVPSVTECAAGDAVTWTTEVTGAYGEVSYIWLFDTEGSVSSIITAEPTVTWTTTKQGLCVASVTAVDALNDQVSARASGVTVGAPVPIYRALLVGNTYPGTSNALPGCDSDVYSMRAMLNAMTGTDYAITTSINVNATGIQGAISSAFADARPCDVSLFYFSGHGTSSGALVGTGNTTVSVATLRAWLDKIPGTKIVIIDACFSGNMIGKAEGSNSPSSFTSAFVSGFSYYTKSDDLANYGYIVMTACTKEQESNSLTAGDVSFGAFTYGVCYGSGYDSWHQTSLSDLPADADGNEVITLGEAYTTAVARVAWLNSLLPSTDQMEQAAQYYGDTSFVLWSCGEDAPEDLTSDSENSGEDEGLIEK